MAEWSSHKGISSELLTVGTLLRNRTSFFVFSFILHENVPIHKDVLNKNIFDTIYCTNQAIEWSEMYLYMNKDGKRHLVNFLAIEP